MAENTGRSDKSVVAAFSEDQAVKLTSLTHTQLRYWDRTGFFVPSLAFDGRRAAYSRIYSFEDIVSLRVLFNLRKNLGVSLQQLRDVRDRLKGSQTSWSGVKLWVLNKKVIWVDRETERPQEIASQQYLAPVVDLDHYVAVTRTDIAAIRIEREPSKVGKIEQRRHVVKHEQVLAGTRIQVRLIKQFADAGYTKKAILLEYPDLTLADVDAALQQKSTHAA